MPGGTVQINPTAIKKSPNNAVTVYTARRSVGRRQLPKMTDLREVDAMLAENTHDFTLSLRMEGRE